MPYEGLRDYLEALEKKGLFHWTNQEVDKDWEIPSLARMIFQGFPEEERFGIGFRNIRGFPGHRLVTGVIAASTQQIVTALETDSKTFFFGKALKDHSGQRGNLPVLVHLLIGPVE